MFDVFYLNTPTYRFPHEKPAESIEHAREQSRTRYLWIVDGLNDYSRFDWTWEPVPWQAHQTHVWPSQHQENGGTYLVPRSGVTEINRDHGVVRRIGGYPRIGIDHGNGLSIQCREKTRYISDYLGTLRRMLGKVSWPYVWVVSSVCDYSNFDFTWHSSEWQEEMLHVWPSDEQKFGDTFLIHVPSFMEKSQDLALLEWFDTIHFVEHMSIPRRPVPIHRHSNDTHVDAVWQHNFSGPVVQFTVGDAVDAPPAINLWREKTKAIVPLSPGATSVLIPREAKNHLKTQLYDYATIDKNHRELSTDQALDIVFISNGETVADHHFDILTQCVKQKSLPNRICRVNDVNGRVAAYQAAALISTTPWFFAVFAKLEVNPDFDWVWQPDRLQQPKHYIFHARNPVNGLVYGHQAMIAYNKRLVLANQGHGLDFTLDDAHEVVPLLSGTAHYEGDAWTCWRTAFREVLKLRHSLPNVENEYRLQRWLTENNSDDFVKWSHLGAQDAMHYYEEVAGDFGSLRRSYEWDWLVTYASMKRPELVIKL